MQKIMSINYIEKSYQFKIMSKAPIQDPYFRFPGTKSVRQRVSKTIQSENYRNNWVTNSTQKNQARMLCREGVKNLTINQHTFYRIVEGRGGINDQQFPDFNNNKLPQLRARASRMAHLRTSFMQAYNSTIPLFSGITGIVSSSGSLFNNEDNDDRNKIKSKEKHPPVKAHRSLHFFRQKQMFFSEEQRSVHSLINLNINNLSQLTDQDSTDFKGHDHFIHALELENQQQESKLLQEMQTIQSLHFQNNIVLAHNESPNSTRMSTEPLTDQDADHSDVEPFEL